MSAFTAVDYLGEPEILNRGYQLRALLTVCERAAASLSNVGDGKYRDAVTDSLGTTLELAENIASDLVSALEDARPAFMTGRQRNG
ncbi:hypothetical protein [Mesorhizobium sp. A556]